MAEVTYDFEDMDSVMVYYGTEEEPLADFPFNFNLIDGFSNRSELTGSTLELAINKWLDNMPDGKWANWVVSLY